MTFDIVSYADKSVSRGLAFFCPQKLWRKSSTKLWRIYTNLLTTDEKDVILYVVIYRR